MDVLLEADVARHDDGRDLATDVLNRLLQAAARVNAERARQLRAVGLSPSAFAVLAELARADDEGLQPCVLSGLLSVTRPSICGLIDGLEAKQFVARVPHRHDGRRVLVRLTTEGADLLAEHRARYERGQRTLVAALAVDEQSHLGRLLDRVGA